MTELQAVAFRPFSRILVRVFSTHPWAELRCVAILFGGDREWALEITVDC